MMISHTIQKHTGQQLHLKFKQLNGAATFSYAVNVFIKSAMQKQNLVLTTHCKVCILFRNEECRDLKIEKVDKMEYYHYLEIILKYHMILLYTDYT